MIKNNNKKGQVTIFILLGIVLVFTILVLSFIFGKDALNFFRSKDTYSEISECIGEVVQPAVNDLLKNGGIGNPAITIRYAGVNYTYLCYTKENFKNCYSINPTPLTSVEKTLREKTVEEVKNCFTTSLKELEKKGYTIDEQELEYSISFVPSSILVKINKKIAISKENSSQVFEDFSFEIKSKFYELLLLANKIVDSNVKSCDFNYLAYTMFKRNYQITEKNFMGSKIYTILEKSSNEEIKFAIRGCIYI